MKRKNLFTIALILISIFILILVSVVITQQKQNEYLRPIKAEIIKGEKNHSKKAEKTIETTLDWAETVEKEEPTLTVWNLTTKEGSLLQDEQEYTLKEGDIIVLCFDEKKDIKLSLNFGIACQVGKGKCFYSMIVQQKLVEPTKITFYLTVDNVEYTKTLYLVTEEENL